MFTSVNWDKMESSKFIIIRNMANIWYSAYHFAKKNLVGEILNRYLAEHLWTNIKNLYNIIIYYYIH